MGDRLIGLTRDRLTGPMGTGSYWTYQPLLYSAGRWVWTEMS